MFKLNFGTDAKLIRKRKPNRINFDFVQTENQCQKWTRGDIIANFKYNN